MPIHRRFMPFAAVLLLSLAACHSQPQGSALFAASLSQALSASDVTRVTVTVSAADMSSIVVDMAKSNGTWGGVIGNIPAGTNRTFLAEAFDASNTKRFQGQASGVTLSANQTTAVALTLQEVSPQAPYGNEAPFIDSAVANPTSVPASGSVSLTSAAHDPNPGDTLTYAWTATAGTFAAATSANTSWTAPSTTGIQTLTLTVTDSQGAAVSVSLSVNVIAGASGNATLDISFNLWPVVAKVSASLNRLDAGQSTSVNATASDADGDALSYQWTASCPGTWTNATSSNASFVPSSVPAGACNNCKLSVTVQDGRGGQTSGSLNLCVASSTASQFPPTVTNFYQSAASSTSGQTVTFDVTGLDPQSSSMTFSWTASAGSLGAPQSTATTSRVVWTAPACLVASTATLTAVVTNAYGLSTSKTFSVSLASLPACAASVFTATTQSATTVSAGQTVTFDVAASDPQSSAMTFAWNANTGSLATAQTTTTTSHVVWTAPSCVPSVVTPTVTAVVTDAYGFSTSKTFSVSGLPACAAAWSSAGSLASPRVFHTATLLPSGKVLVAGGGNCSTPVASAQLYDPADNSWSSAGNMTQARRGHSATRLPSGKVLIAGGYNSASSSSGPLNSAELYDPANNSWSPTPNMAQAHAFGSATLLNSGKVLVAGGDSTTSAELYDPVNNSWSSAGNMAQVRVWHTAILLNSGKVLIAGGGYPTVLASAELYDPTTNSWSSAGTMSVTREEHVAALLPSGKVLVAGGYIGSDTVTASADLYNPATNTWSSTNPKAQGACDAPNVSVLASGKVLLSGGWNNAPLTSAEIFDPTTNTWSSTSNMAQGRWHQTSTLLPSGRVLVTGGGINGNGTSCTATAELYTP